VYKPLFLINTIYEGVINVKGFLTPYKLLIYVRLFPMVFGPVKSRKQARRASFLQSDPDLGLCRPGRARILKSRRLRALVAAFLKSGYMVGCPGASALVAVWIKDGARKVQGRFLYWGNVRARDGSAKVPREQWTNRIEQN